MSLKFFNSNDVQYSALLSISNISIETSHDNAVTNSNAQKSMNNVLNKNLNNNANDTSNNITDFNTITNQKFSQIFINTRRTKFFERIALESLSSLEELNENQRLTQQQYEIERIIADFSDETLEQFFHTNKVAMTQIYKQLSVLIHSDKQSEK